MVFIGDKVVYQENQGKPEACRVVSDDAQNHQLIVIASDGRIGAIDYRSVLSVKRNVFRGVLYKLLIFIMRIVG